MPRAVKTSEMHKPALHKRGIDCKRKNQRSTESAIAKEITLRKLENFHLN